MMTTCPGSSVGKDEATVSSPSNLIPSDHDDPSNKPTPSGPNEDSFPPPANRTEPFETCTVIRKDADPFFQVCKIWPDASSDEIMLFSVAWHFDVEYAGWIAHAFRSQYRPSWLELIAETYGERKGFLDAR